MNDALSPNSAVANEGFVIDSETSLIPSDATNTSSSSALAQTHEARSSGKVLLDDALLRQLRRLRLLSQQDLADDCWRRNIRVSIATIKRAESGHAVRFRIAHELARCFGVPVLQIVGAADRGARP